MKKIIAILTLLALLLCGCGEGTTASGDGNKKPNTSCTLSDGCDESVGDTATAEINLKPTSAQEALENAMKSIKNLDEDGVSYYFTQDFWDWMLSAKDQNKFALVKKAFPYMTYEISNVEVISDTVVKGTVKIKAVDMGYLYLDVQTRLNDWSNAMLLGDYEVTYEGRQNEMYRIFESELDDPATFTYSEQEVTIYAHKSESGAWFTAADESGFGVAFQSLQWALFGTVTWGMGM